MPGGACCILEICCPPPQAKADLAEHLAAMETRDGGYEEIAGHIIDEFRLVPKTLEPGDGPTDAGRIETATERLAALHVHIEAELREILTGLGHSVEHEG